MRDLEALHRIVKRGPERVFGVVAGECAIQIAPPVVDGLELIAPSPSLMSSQ